MKTSKHEDDTEPGEPPSDSQTLITWSPQQPGHSVLRASLTLVVSPLELGFCQRLKTHVL